MTDIIYWLIIIDLLLYPVAIGFCFSVKGLKISKRIYYAALAILLALSNMILVIAIYQAFLKDNGDNWFNLIFFILFELLLLITSVLHFIMVLRKLYNHKLILMLSVFLLISGICYSVSFIIFSNPYLGEGLTIVDALLSLLPTLLSATFFALAGSDKEAFLPSLKPSKKKKSDTKD